VVERHVHLPEGVLLGRLVAEGHGPQRHVRDDDPRPPELHLPHP
jgi:hypothetical protein